jgi:DNA polymerase-3 subunit gamma/tau
MSYQVLARKWRPRSFSTLVGQEHVVRALTHALAEKRLHHAYLFTGTRGVGKTTLARILAKSLNCESGISATPCGVCGACQEIDSGRFVDLLEVDAATNTKVDEMRQLLENAIYAPTRGRFKVYVIDEVHMLSNSAFNAMLKTLEEPPEHVKFILATTDPQKIPVTVLSRCLQFNLKQMPPVAISGHMRHVLEAEGVVYDLPSLALIARSAAGSMRDALSLLDQAIAHGAGRVEEDQVRVMLGTVDLDFLFNILEAVQSGDAGELLRIASDMAVRSLSFGAALQELATLLTRIQIAQAVPGAIDDDEPERLRLLSLAKEFSSSLFSLHIKSFFTAGRISR